MVETAVTELPESFGMLSCLMVLNMGKKHQKREDTEEINFIVPASFSNLSLLYELHARACNISGKIADDFEKLSSLEILNLGRNNFSSPQASLRGLSLLKKLLLPHCKKLKALPPLPSSLEEVDAANCISLESISDISNLENLVMMNLTSCEKVVDIPGLECLKSLEQDARLVFSRCGYILGKKNCVLKSVIIGVVVSLNQQIPDDIREELPAIVDILGQILKLDFPTFTSALILLGVPNTNEDQVHLCRYPIDHPLVSQLKDGYKINEMRKEPPMMKGVELKKWGSIWSMKVMMIMRETKNH
ncbi:PREDICTED: TMV resistance [Prunus dulcis]|uniref:PREDICTED: TMV resistance n=1 Tax=Prunus dulcis TaxID=3755 RepID=A0A5E4FAN2_PRUDU|nr:PREDICTED: TMV resistance [Prunus dulcis]